MTHRKLRRLAAAIVLAGASLACASCGASPPSSGALPAELLLPHGNITVVGFSNFRGGRPVAIYVPPGGGDGRPMRILFVLDGQSTFRVDEGLALGRVADSLLACGRIEPTIIAAIYSLPDPGRTDEYTPWPASSGLDGGGARFLLAVRDTLLPDIRARLGVARTQPTCGLMGYSLGGLMATYGGFALSSTFTRVAALSPSYWWSDANVEALPRVYGRGGLARFYQDTGDVNDNLYSPLTELATLGDSVGFTPDCDQITRLIPGGNHSIVSWARRMPTILAFLAEPDSALPCAVAPGGATAAR